MAGGGSSGPISSAAGAPSRVVGPLVEAAADPAQPGVVALVEPGRLPDRHAAEVRAARVRIPDARNDRQPARFQQLPRVAHRRVQADLAVDLDQPLLGQPDGLAVPGVPVVLERDDRVDAVVAAVELHDDQDAAVFLGAGGVRRPRQEAGQRRAPGRSASNPAGRGRGSLGV